VVGATKLHKLEARAGRRHRNPDLVAEEAPGDVTVVETRESA